MKNKLVISKSELIITGSSSGTTEIKGTLKGIIEITGNKVIFDHIKIVGSNNVVEENSHVITIKGTEFDSNQVQYNIESGNFDSILYYDVTDPDSALFYNTFNGDNNTSTYVKFNQEVDGNEEIDSSVKSNGTSITGNKIVDSENNAITFLEMKKVKENTVLNIRQIDQAFNNNNSKLLKLDAEPSNSNVTVNLSSIWTSAGSQKKCITRINGIIYKI